ATRTARSSSGAVIGITSDCLAAPTLTSPLSRASPIATAPTREYGEAAPGTAMRSRAGTSSRRRRGGAWNDESFACRAAFRLRYDPPRRSDHIGFRVVVVQT